MPIPEEALKDINRMLALWDESRKATKERLAILGEADEGFLFGGFSIADAFFWPVLWVRNLLYWGFMMSITDNISDSVPTAFL